MKGNFSATATERKSALVELRERFATITNSYLEQHGHTGRVTHLSLKEQGSNRAPERHFGPKFIRTFSEEDFDSIMTLRDAEGALERAQTAAGTIDISSSLEAVFDQRLTIEQIKAELRRLTPPTLTDACNGRPDFTAALHDEAKNKQERKSAEAAHEQVLLDIAGWREAHPVRATMHDKGLALAEPLSRLAAALQAAAERIAAAIRLIADAVRRQDDIRAVEQRRIAKQEQASADRVRELNALLAKKTTAPPDATGGASTTLDLSGLSTRSASPAVPSSTATKTKPK